MSTDALWGTGVMGMVLTTAVTAGVGTLAVLYFLTAGPAALWRFAGSTQEEVLT